MENLFNFVRFESLGQTQHRTTMKRFSIIAILLLAALQTFGAVRLPAVLSDGMVLQRNEPIKVWGWAGSNEKFDIFWNGKKVHVTASSDGTWEAVLPEMRAGGPYTMIIGDI
jgi:sialate O-acetylesterase